MPNNSIGGQVNLITKSSFEYAQPTYSGRVFFNFNSMDPDLKKTPGPVKGSTFKTTPGLEFTVTQPFSRTLGIAFTGYAAREYKNNYRVQPTFSYTGTYSNLAGQQISLANPALSRFQIQATPMMVDKVSGNLRVDWKPSPSQSIRANVQYSTYDSVEAQRNLDIRPTMAAGADWSATKSIGTTANSTTSMVVRTRDKVGNTRSAQLAYDLNLAGWKIAAKEAIRFLKAISATARTDTFRKWRCGSIRARCIWRTSGTAFPGRSQPMNAEILRPPSRTTHR